MPSWKRASLREVLWKGENFKEGGDGECRREGLGVKRLRATDTEAIALATVKALCALCSFQILSGGRMKIHQIQSTQ